MTAAGLLCNPHDPASIADGVARALGAAGRRRAERLHALSPLVDRNISHYERCLGKD